MIRVDRNRKDENEEIIGPSNWINRSTQETKRVLDCFKENKNYKFTKKDLRFYKNKEVHLNLEKLFYDKCAYCEREIIRSYWDVEHYRPKSRYYWLVYNWNNLYLSCNKCNRARKNDQFPLEIEEARISDPDSDIASEKPLLLDPCNDDPEECLIFDLEGETSAISSKGETSIQIFNLNDAKLRKRRKKKIDLYLSFARLSQKKSDTKDEMIRLMEQMCSDEEEFAGAIRSIKRLLERCPEIIQVNQEKFYNS
jgi:uncharacterized protein (TIGR02646 family)